jgi:hypothetical protein
MKEVPSKDLLARAVYRRLRVTRRSQITTVT